MIWRLRPPRDTDLCGAWRCRAEKLQQQPQHWQSLHPRRGHTAPATPRVVTCHTCPSPHLLCSATLCCTLDYWVSTAGTSSCLPPRARPWRCCGGTAETRPRSRVESTRDTHTLTLLTSRVTLSHWYWYWCCTVQIIGDVTYTVTHPWPAVPLRGCTAL